ncbi:MAG: hypothetical protein V3U56_10180 [Syntrophobacteria bacterium]
MGVLPGVLGSRLLRRTVQARLGTDTLRLPGGTPIFMLSRQRFMKYPGFGRKSFKRSFTRERESACLKLLRRRLRN